VAASAAIEVNRPRALIGKYGLGATTMLLNGAAKMSFQGQKCVSMSWNELGAFRAILMREFSYFASSETNVPQDIFYLHVRMMKFAHMTHVRLIYEMLIEHPWAADWQPLSGSVRKYLSHLDALARIPEEEQPFIKLIYGDKLDLFPRKELQALTACSLAVLEQNNDDLGDYYHDSQFGAVADQFMEELAARNAHAARQRANERSSAAPAGEMPRTLALAQEETGVELQFLPPRPHAVTAPAQPAVASRPGEEGITTLSPEEQAALDRGDYDDEQGHEETETSDGGETAYPAEG